MAEKTKIQWTDSSWNPIVAYDRETGKRGWFCTHASKGCEHCYAAQINKRVGTGHDFIAQNRRHVRIALAPPGGQSALDWPLRTKKPRMIFVCDMTDLFGEFVPEDFIMAVYTTMAKAQQHTFQVLTKRPERRCALLPQIKILLKNAVQSADYDWPGWPLPNVWEGVSCEDQPTANKRIWYLQHCPAAVRFVSYEPALGPVDYTPYLWGQCNVCNGFYSNKQDCACLSCDSPENLLDWIIFGGESGKDARPCDIQWARNTRDQCQDAGVACFIKQFGSKPISQHWPPDIGYRGDFDHNVDGSWELLLSDSHGGDMAEWPEDLRVREFPNGGIER